MQLGAALVAESFRRDSWACVRCFSQSSSVAHSLSIRNIEKLVKGFDLSESVISLVGTTFCLPRPEKLGPGGVFCCLEVEVVPGRDRSVVWT